MSLLTSATGSTLRVIRAVLHPGVGCTKQKRGLEAVSRQSGHWPETGFAEIETPSSQSGDTDHKRTSGPPRSPWPNLRFARHPTEIASNGELRQRPSS